MPPCRRRRSRSLSLALVASLLVGAGASAQTAGTRVHLDIAAQDLSNALTQFGRDTGTEIVFAPEAVRDKTTAAVKGDFERERAIALLLDGTGLTYRVTAQGAIVIESPGSGGTRDKSSAVVGDSEFRLAQDGNARAGSSDGSAQTQSAAEGGLDEVIVSGSRATTATKTDTPLIETPQAISVVTSDQFISRGALLFEETLRYSAGVNPESFGTDERLSNAVVRGFMPADYLDGLRRVIGFANVGRLDVYQLERVEVLRGPSSVLYGAGSAGGLINHVTKRPQFTPSSEVGVQFGSYDRRQAQFDLTGPLGASDAFAGRVIGVARDSGTQVNHVADDRLLLNPSFTWRPAEGTEVTMIGNWVRDRLGLFPQFQPLAASLLAPAGRRLPDDFFGGEPGFDKIDVNHKSIALLASHRVSDAINLSSTLRYMHVTNRTNVMYVNSFEDQDPSTPEIDPFIDPDNEIMPRFATKERQNIKSFAIDNRAELRLQQGRLTHKFLAGIDYQRFTQAGAFGFSEAEPLNVYNPVYGNIPTVVTDPSPKQRVSQFGVYLQDQIDYADRTHFVFGVRRDRAPSRTEPDPEQVDNATTFRAAVIADVWRGLSPYFSYAESFIPVAGYSAFNQDPFVPQEGTMYEAGVKWQPQLRTLVTLAAFNIRETNRFTNHPTDPNLLIQQGEVRSRGIEIEASHRSESGTELTASYSYVDAEISRSNTPAEVGLQLDTTPKHQATAWGLKRFELGNDLQLRIGGGVRYMGEHYSTGILRLPSYTLVDAVMGLDRDRWSFSLNASNLLDKRHYSTCLYRGDCYVGLRRNVVGTVNYRF